MMSGEPGEEVEEVKERISAFEHELDKEIEKNQRSRKFDAGLHQFLVIGAALAGFASLGIGLYSHNGPLAGLIGALASVATVLSQQLHCVKAVNWHQRMAVEVEGIKTQWRYELKLDRSFDDIAPLAKQLRTLRSQMATEWERVTSVEPVRLGLPPTEHHHKGRGLQV